MVRFFSSVPSTLKCVRKLAKNAPQPRGYVFGALIGRLRNSRPKFARDLNFNFAVSWSFYVGFWCKCSFYIKINTSTLKKNHLKILRSKPGQQIYLVKCRTTREPRRPNSCFWVFTFLHFPKRIRYSAVKSVYDQSHPPGKEHKGGFWFTVDVNKLYTSISETLVMEFLDHALYLNPKYRFLED